MTGDIIITQQQMNEFITNAFNYFNGRINIFNKARLINSSRIILFQGA